MLDSSNKTYEVGGARCSHAEILKMHTEYDQIRIKNHLADIILDGRTLIRRIRGVKCIHLAEDRWLGAFENRVINLLFP